jgi:ribonuclease P protein component
MLRKIDRLKKEDDFRKILREGKSHKEDSLVLKYLPNRRQNTRIGISVSKKVSKKAVLRNKQKRRLASLARQKIHQIRKGLDIFLIALPGIEAKTFSETKTLCDKIFLKAKILENDKKNSDSDD